MKLNSLSKDVGLENLVICDEHNQKATIIAKNPKLPCVIYGETGTGKEEFAKLVHKRREINFGRTPFVSINCANIDNNLASSLLFGHVKGSFSGAGTTTEGLIGKANGGILFLDEIQALSFETQQRMLRVLNDGSYTKLGGTKTLYSEFQVICATTKDLDEEIENNRFLIDLRSRLLGIEIKPLRNRKEDIARLIDIFFSKNNLHLDEQEYKRLVGICESYYWQGNIRQLFHVLTAWVALCDGNLDVDFFPSYKSMFAPKESSAKIDKPYNEIIDIVTSAICLSMPLNDALERIESFILRNAIRDSYNLTDVYQGMKLSRNNFYIKRRKYGLTDEHKHEELYS